MAHQQRDGHASIHTHTHTHKSNKSNKHAARPSVSQTRPAPQSYTSYASGNTGLYTTTSSTVSGDSGLFSAYSPSSRSHPKHDFQLYDSDPEYLDEDASIFPNYTSASQRSDRQTSTYSTDNTPPSQGSHMVYKPIESNRPSLFGEYEQVYAPTSTTSPLYQWAVQPWRHENRAVHFASLPAYQRPYHEDIRLTPEPTSQSPPSPKHRRSRSGSSKSVRRRKQ